MMVTKGKGYCGAIRETCSFTPIGYHFLYPYQMELPAEEARPVLYSYSQQSAWVSIVENVISPSLTLTTQLVIQ